MIYPVLFSLSLTCFVLWVLILAVAWVSFPLEAIESWPDEHWINRLFYAAAVGAIVSLCGAVILWTWGL